MKFSSAEGEAPAGVHLQACNGPSGVNRGTLLSYNYGDVFRGEINVDAQDRPWVASVTGASNFPMVNAPYPDYGGGSTDAVLFRMSADLANLEWSTFLGGSSADAAYGIQFAPNGEAVVCGGTTSADFPVSPNGDDTSFGGSADGLQSASRGAGAPTGGTLFGTSQYDQAYFVQLDAIGQVYLFGQSTGNKPVSLGRTQTVHWQGNLWHVCLPGWTIWCGTRGWETPPIQGALTSALRPSSSAIAGDLPQRMGGNSNNSSPFIFTSSTEGMPVTDGAFQTTSTGGDFWLAVMDPGGVGLSYATFFGGPDSGEHVDGGTSRFDKDGTVYQAMCAGCGGNSDLPTTPGAWSDTNDSFNCNLGVFKFELGELEVGIDVATPGILCDGLDVAFSNTSTPGYEYLWVFDSFSTSTEYEPTHTFPNPGSYTVVLTVTDPAGCLEPVDTEIEVNIQAPPNPVILPVDPVCEGEEVQLIANGTSELVWTANPLIADVTAAVQNITPSPGTSVFSVTDSNNCGEATASINVVVQSVAALWFLRTPPFVWRWRPLVAEGAANATWTPAVGLDNANATAVVASPTETTTYSVLLTDDIGCTGTTDVTVSVVPGPPGEQVYPTETICLGFGTRWPQPRATSGCGARRNS